MAEGGDGALGAELSEAGRALQTFADGPAREAGEALEAAFARAGRAIRGELENLARTGEADLKRLAMAAAETLARLAVERVSGGGGTGAPVNVTMNFSGAQGGEGVGSANQIATAVARAVQRGARFS